MTPPVDPGDDDLLRRMLEGDDAAFTLLFRRHQGRIYRYALQMSGSTTIAEDVTQDVFLLLIREGERFDARRGSVGAFLLGVARILVLRRLSYEGSQLPLAEERTGSGAVIGSPSVSVFRADPLDGLSRKETVVRVRRAVLSLPAEYREVVVLCDLQEMSYEAAAEALRCPTGTVRSRLHRARGLLLEKLRPRHGQRRSTAVRE